MSNLYFAYGSNLWREQMKKRCPGHKLLGTGFLKGYRWIISRRGYANIIKSMDDTVIGTVYEITKDDEDNLDRYEGVHSGSYIKETLDIFIEGKIYKCLVYIDPIVQEGIPKKEYINRINQGVSDANLSNEYVIQYIRKYIPENT